MLFLILGTLPVVLCVLLGLRYYTGIEADGMWVAADCLLIYPEAILQGLRLSDVNNIALCVHWGLRSIPSQ